MKHGEGHTIYMLGIGGIGMSALARYYHSFGYTVAGYDRTPSPLTKQLENEGMAIHYEDNPNQLPALIDIVIYTPAVPQDLKEFEVLRQRGIPILKRSEALGQVSEHHFTIAVAGTHGKTTTTAMVAHILYTCGKNTTAFNSEFCRKCHEICKASKSNSGSADLDSKESRRYGYYHTGYRQRY